MKQQSKIQMGKVEWAMLLTLSLLWGSSFINLKLSLTEMEPFTLVFMRVAIAAIALILWCLFRRKSMKMSFKQHLIIFGLGMVLTAIPFSFFTWGQKYISTSMASIINGTVPFFTALFAHFLLGHSERLTKNKVIGLLIGFIGILTIIGPEAITNFDLTNFGQVSIIIACFFYAVSGIYTKLYVPQALDNTVVATYSLIWATLVMAIVATFFDGLPAFNYSAKVWLSISILGVLSTAVTYVILFRLIRRAGASNTSLTTFIIPIFAIGIGIIILDESLELKEIIGVLLILLGVAFIQNMHKSIKTYLAK